MKYEIFCDESSHLISQPWPAALGALAVPADMRVVLSKLIKDTKIKYGIPAGMEVKWTKISASKLDLYKELLSIYLDQPLLRFRAIVAHKDGLTHEAYGQTHQEWLHKLYFSLFKNFLNEAVEYRIFFDPMDTWAHRHASDLIKILNKRYPEIKAFRVVDSTDAQLMQITDILVGILSYGNRPEAQITNPVKKELVKFLEKRTGSKIRSSSPLSATKFNVFHWDMGKK